MYYFLSNLSFIDMCHSTVITPKMLVNFVMKKNIISYPECMTQLYFFSVFAISECHMLAAMAYDRYVAICSPLLYSVIMSHHLCFWLTAGVYILASILRIRSTEGRAKAFSTCSSHISAVALFFGSAAFMYLQPSAVSSMDQGKVSSVFYTTVVPVLNPLIYSLRNKDVKSALKKCWIGHGQSLYLLQLSHAGACGLFGSASIIV
ncbi:Hypothetical predicted protein [Marmota monax]|uniref:G-protein coupled receptors family 1 profile domain-containing protein n=1 Tax=Marmota monax TaxID=9995 RepID=A0A5E4CV20_MARMO|nr:hypothetical protein GHT09_011914 [Marmota monax]VTJ84891.1 Hypothetical predicted protein [Marmota monax]